MGLDRRGVVVQTCYRSNPKGEDFCGQSETVLYCEARCVGSIQAGEGKPRIGGSRWRVDCGVRTRFEEQSLSTLESDVVRQLLPARSAPGGIPKEGGRTRPLGIPTVSDRIAQAVVQRYLEPILEPVFHKDSYGYRPGRSAHDALAVARQRCWRHNWVLDLDIKSFFDEINWELLMRAVRHHTDCAWVLLYIERWLQAPVLMPDGSLVKREKGTPQGSVVSPILANLFLHYVFDMWMQRQFPACPFERYADDAIIHCGSENQARQVLDMLQQRFAECKLELHPQKTKIVYCKDANRQGIYPEQNFDFLGYSFRPRGAMNRSRNMF